MRVYKILSSFVLGSMLLVGCSATSSPGPATETPQKVEQHEKSKKDVSALEEEITVKYELEGMEEVKKAHLYVSTNQPFYTYVIEGFKATAAEPGLDQIFYELSSENNMNVEVYDKYTAFDAIESNVSNTLQSIGEPKKLDPREAFGGRIVDAESYWQVATNDYLIHVVIRKIDNVYVKFTIHTQIEWESIIPFIVMIGKTGIK